MNNPQPWWLTWPVAEVAAAILPLIASHAAQHEPRVIHSIVSWFQTGSYTLLGAYSSGTPPHQFASPDFCAAAEAMQLLEHSGLLMRGQAHSESVFVGLTRRGWHAVQTNTVRQHLGLSETPPTTL
jgi:hypothetical protein